MQPSMAPDKHSYQVLLSEMLWTLTRIPESLVQRLGYRGVPAVQGAFDSVSRLLRRCGLRPSRYRTMDSVYPGRGLWTSPPCKRTLKGNAAERVRVSRFSPGQRLGGLAPTILPADPLNQHLSRGVQGVQGVPLVNLQSSELEERGKGGYPPNPLRTPARQTPLGACLGRFDDSRLQTGLSHPGSPRFCQQRSSRRRYRTATRSAGKSGGQPRSLLTKD